MAYDEKSDKIDKCKHSYKVNINNTDDLRQFSDNNKNNSPSDYNHIQSPLSPIMPLLGSSQSKSTSISMSYPSIGASPITPYNPSNINDAASIAKSQSARSCFSTNSTISELTVWYESDDFCECEDDEKGTDLYDDHVEDDKNDFIEWIYNNQSEQLLKYPKCLKWFEQHINEEYNDDDFDTENLLDDLIDDDNDDSVIMTEIRENIQQNNKNQNNINIKHKRNDENEHISEDCEIFKKEMIQMIKRYKIQKKKHQHINYKKNALYPLYICTGKRCDNRLAQYMFNRHSLERYQKLEVIEDYFWSPTDKVRKVLVAYLKIPSPIPFKKEIEKLHDLLENDTFYIDDNISADIDIVDLFEKVLFHKHNGRLLCKLSQITCHYKPNNLRTEVRENKKDIKINLSTVKKQIDSFSLQHHIEDDEFIALYMLENNNYFKILNQNYTKIQQFDCEWKKFYMVLSDLMSKIRDIGKMNFNANDLILYYFIPNDKQEINMENINIILNEYSLWSTNMDFYEENEITKTDIIICIINPDPNILSMIPIPFEGVIDIKNRKFLLEPFTVPTPKKNIIHDIETNIFTIKDYKSSTIICVDNDDNQSSSAQPETNSQKVNNNNDESVNSDENVI